MPTCEPLLLVPRCSMWKWIIVRNEESVSFSFVVDTQSGLIERVGATVSMHDGLMIIIDLIESIRQMSKKRSVQIPKSLVIGALQTNYCT